MAVYHDTRTAHRCFPVEAKPMHRQPVATYPTGRRCLDCHSTLSIYNEGPSCHACHITTLERLQRDELDDWVTMMRQGW
jgi:hypothetical protein